MMTSSPISLKTSSNEFMISMFLPFCLPISAPITSKNILYSVHIGLEQIHVKLRLFLADLPRKVLLFWARDRVQCSDTFMMTNGCREQVTEPAVTAAITLFSGSVVSITLFLSAGAPVAAVSTSIVSSFAPLISATNFSNECFRSWFVFIRQFWQRTRSAANSN